jgi:hypothetical protein
MSVRDLHAGSKSLPNASNGSSSNQEKEVVFGRTPVSPKPSVQQTPDVAPPKQQQVYTFFTNTYIDFAQTLTI